MARRFSSSVETIELRTGTSRTLSEIGGDGCAIRPKPRMGCAELGDDGTAASGSVGSIGALGSSVMASPLRSSEATLIAAE
jgi:hypothetical protein